MAVDLSLLELSLAALVGGGVGLASTFLGIGGGVLIVPLLPAFAGVSPRVAIGTSLLTVFLVAAQNTRGFHLQRLIDWNVAAGIGGFAAAAAFLAARLTAYLPGAALQGTLAALLCYLAWQALSGRAHKPAGPGASRVERSLGLVASVGLGSGLVSGFTGIGGGVLVVPILSLLRWVTPEKVVPTSVATIFFTSLAGTFAFLSEQAFAVRESLSSSGNTGLLLGFVRLDLALALFLGATLTSILGLRHQRRLPARKRDWLVGALLLALSGRLLFTAFFK